MIGYPVGTDDDGNDEGEAEGNDDGKLDDGAVEEGYCVSVVGMEVGILEVGTELVGDKVENSAVVDGTEEDGTDEEGIAEGAEDGVLLVGSADQVGEEDEGRLLGTVVEGANVFRSFIDKSARPIKPFEIEVARSPVPISLPTVSELYSEFTLLSEVWEAELQSSYFAASVHA